MKLAWAFAVAIVAFGFAFNLVALVGEVWLLCWAFVHMCQFAGHHPIVITAFAVVFMAINWAYVRGMREERADWVRRFIGSA